MLNHNNVMLEVKALLGKYEAGLNPDQAPFSVVYTLWHLGQHGSNEVECGNEGADY